MRRILAAAGPALTACRERPKVRLVAMLAAFAFAACETALPVKYEICGTGVVDGNTDCRVHARFRDFDDCEWHRNLSLLLARDHQCEANGVQVVCRQGMSLGLSTTHCTR